MIKRDGSETRLITSIGYEDTEPSFSPVGDHIAFRRNGPPSAIAAPGQVVLKRIGWEVERGYQAATDVDWITVR